MSTDRTATPPLSAKIFMILLAFAEGSAHGYEVRRLVEERSRGAVRLDAGSLYRAIAKLTDAGHLEETEERPPAADDDPRRRYYRLTAAGRRLLAAEASRMAELVEMARGHALVEHGKAAG